MENSNNKRLFYTEIKSNHFARAHKTRRVI